MEEIQIIVDDIRELMKKHEGHLTGTFCLAAPNAGPGGRDVRFTLTFPDWSRIGSIPTLKS
jgi:hypothetical protein